MPAPSILIDLLLKIEGDHPRPGTWDGGYTPRVIHPVGRTLLPKRQQNAALGHWLTASTGLTSALLWRD